MKLTIKDKDFLEKLKSLLEQKELKINLKEDGLKRFVLRQNYGDKVEKAFGMTRQGVRWRFHHLMRYMYWLTRPSTSLRAISVLSSGPWLWRLPGNVLP